MSMPPPSGRGKGWVASPSVIWISSESRAAFTLRCAASTTPGSAHGSAKSAGEFIWIPAAIGAGVVVVVLVVCGFFAFFATSEHSEPIQRTAVPVPGPR